MGDIRHIFKDIPDRWFWEPHRIPRSLEDKFLSFYVLEFIQRRIPNPQDLNRYYHKIYVMGGKV